MLNTIIVDDEPLVRIAFKSMVDWNSMGYYISGDFSNGLDALKYIESNSVDVVVTDIKMPVMDGIDLIRHVKENYKDIVLVVLSAYDDFYLVKKAFLLGIEDYILKLEMNETNLKKLFLNLCTKIDKQKNEVRESDSMKDIMSKNISVIQSSLLKDIIWGGKSKTEKVDEEIKRLGLRLNNGNNCICCIAVDNMKIIRSKYLDDGRELFTHSVLNIIIGILNEYNLGDAFSNSFDEYILIFSNPKHGNTSHTQPVIYKICDRIAESFKRYMNISVTIGISSILGNGYDKLHCLYEQARFACDMKFFIGNGRIVNYNAIKFNTPLEENEEKNRLVSLKKLLDSNSIEADDFLGGIIISEDTYFGSEIGKIKLLFDKYVSIILGFTEVNGYYEDVKTAISQYYNEIRQDGIMKEYNEWVINIIKLIFQLKHCSNSLVYKAKQYIHENFTKDISLLDTAKCLNVSVSHLSRIFAEKVGETFSKYLMRVRINKAIEYLQNTDKKIYEIADLVGYSCTGSLSRAFSEVTGQSPKKFVN